MINPEELKKKIKLFTQDAWRRDFHTTINDMIEYIVGETALVLLEEFNSELETVYSQLEEVLEHASKDGGLSESQGSTEIPAKGTRRSPTKARN